MQNMVKQIVDMDRKAREITDAAQLEKINSEKEILQRREEIRAGYLERARHRIALNEPVEREAAEAKWVAVKERNTELSQELDETYAKHGAQWVDQIVARVIGE